VLLEDFCRVVIDFHLEDGAHAGTLKPKLKTADAAE